MIDPLREIEAICKDLEMPDDETCDFVTDAWLFEWGREFQVNARLVTEKAIMEMRK